MAKCLNIWPDFPFVFRSWLFIKFLSYLFIILFINNCLEKCKCQGKSISLPAVFTGLQLHCVVQALYIGFTNSQFCSGPVRSPLLGSGESRLKSLARTSIWGLFYRVTSCAEGWSSVHFLFGSCKNHHFYSGVVLLK